MFKKPEELEVGDVIIGHPYCTWTLTTKPVDAFKVGNYRCQATPSNPEYETYLSWDRDWLVEVAD